MNVDGKRPVRCRYFHPDGTPKGAGCSKGTLCGFQHPDNPGWEDAYAARPFVTKSRNLASEGWGNSERRRPSPPRRSPPPRRSSPPSYKSARPRSSSPDFRSRSRIPSSSSRRDDSPPPRRRSRDRDMDVRIGQKRPRNASRSRERSSSPRRGSRYDDAQLREGRRRSGSRGRDDDRERTRTRTDERERSRESRRREESGGHPSARLRNRTPKRELGPEPSLKRTPPAPAAMRKASWGTRSPTPLSRRSSFATLGAAFSTHRLDTAERQTPSYPPSASSITIPPPEKLHLLPEYQLLIQVLEEEREKGRSRPLLSSIAVRLLQREPNLYRRTKTKDLAEYISRAISAGMITRDGLSISLSERHDLPPASALRTPTSGTPMTPAPPAPSIIPPPPPPIPAPPPPPSSQPSSFPVSTPPEAPPSTAEAPLAPITLPASTSNAPLPSSSPGTQRTVQANNIALDSIPPPPQPPALLTTLASGSVTANLDSQAWDDRIQRISAYLRVSQAYTRVDNDIVASRMYRTLGTSNSRSPGNLAQLQKHKAELFSDRDKALSAVAEQRIWPVDPRTGPSEAQEMQRAEALDELTAFAKAVNDLYELMTDVFARHKKQQERELEDAKAEEEASRKRSREDEEAPAGPEQEVADILSKLELETREMQAGFADQEAEIHEDLDNQVLELCDALGAPETIDVDEPQDDEDLPTPEARTEEQMHDMERLGQIVVDVAQTLASNEGAHQVVIKQRDEIAKLRAEVAEFNQQAPELQRELEQLTARQAKLNDELDALLVSFEAHSVRHPPTPPQSPMHQPTSLLDVPGYLSLERTEEGTPASIEEDIAQAVRTRLMPMLKNARGEIGQAFAAQGAELVGTVRPQVMKVVRAMEAMAQMEAAAVRPAPTAPMGVWGARPA